MDNSLFLSRTEKVVHESFLENGYYIFPLQKYDFLDKCRSFITKKSKEFLKIDSKILEADFLNNAQEFIKVEQLNDLRVYLINELNSQKEILPELYHLGKNFIDAIVGNELCIQRSVNLSIQLPNDKSSLLPLHTDVWSGNSPYEVVFWLPLVDCYNSKSMYILPYKESQKVIENFSEYSHLNAEELYQSIKEKVVNIEVPYGHAALFSHSLLHGNRVNNESSTRWSFNIRLKSALSPYGTKELGETFLPINIKPATRIGYSYKKPKLDS